MIVEIFFLLFFALTQQNVLIVGDSQACAMKFGAVKAVKALNENVDIVCKGGTRTSYWEGSKMKDALAQKRYDAVIIFLGSNDYGSKPDPKKIVQQVHNAGVKACVWVGPPLIRGRKSATNTHLKANVPPCAYLDSQSMNIPLADGVHPTSAGAVMWLKKAWQIKDFLINASQP